VAATITLSDHRRLVGARRLATHLAEVLRADFVLRLWNDETVPLGPQASGDLAVAIRSPVAITQLLRRPRLATVIELLAAGDLAIEGGTLLDLAARRGAASRGLARRLDKWLVARTLLPFLFAPSRGGSKVSHAYDGRQEAGAISQRDDKALVQFHYDLSNAFYALFLDSQMVYSCGYFPTPDTSLDDAQATKLDRICRKLRLRPGDRFLDIGCGWGGLLIHAARNYGVQGHGVTLSQAQFDYANAKVAELGLSERIKIEMRDYRAIEAPEGYDKVAQVGMFEHVGLDNHDRHFAHVHKLLRPRGLYMHHAITRWATPDLAKFRKPTRYQKVISRFIFPGGELDYVGLTATNLERHGFEVHDVEGMREHYQLTLERWLDRLYENREVAAAEVGKTRMRLWMLYFAMFARAFERGTIGIFQTLASKRNVGASGLDLARIR